MIFLSPDAEGEGHSDPFGCQPLTRPPDVMQPLCRDRPDLKARTFPHVALSSAREGCGLHNTTGRNLPTVEHPFSAAARFPFHRAEKQGSPSRRASCKVWGGLNP